MRLILKGSDNLHPFILRQLIPQMRRYFIKSINKKQLIRFDEYLNQHRELFTEDNRHLSTYHILVECVNTLRCTKISETYIIEMDFNKNIKNSNAKLLWVAKLVNYGNMELTPYPIFSEMFNHFSKNINAIYSKYIRR